MDDTHRLDDIEVEEYVRIRREHREALRGGRRRRRRVLLLFMIGAIPIYALVLRGALGLTMGARSSAARTPALTWSAVRNGVGDAFAALAFWKNGPVKIRMKVLQPVVFYGRKVAVMGLVTPANLGESSVRIEARSHAGRWHALGAVRPSARGAFETMVAPRENGFLRARVADRGVSKDIPIIVRPVATMNASGTAFWHRPFAVKGSVLPTSAGTRVVIQIKRGSAWRAFRTARTDQAGSYVVAWRPSSVGERTYRALVPQTAARAAAVSPGKKIAAWYMVALTFDDGPWPPYTDEILDTLRLRRVHATFFVLGQMVQQNPSLVKRAVREGNVVGNHSYSHPALTRLSDDRLREELRSTSNLVAKASGRRPRWMRPPGGATNERVNSMAKELGMKVDIWDITAVDWEGGPSYRTITRRVMEQVRPSDTVLMHDGGGDRSQTAKAINFMIEQLKARDYLPVTIDQIYPGSSAPKPLLPGAR